MPNSKKSFILASVLVLLLSSAGMLWADVFPRIASIHGDCPCDSGEIQRNATFDIIGEGFRSTAGVVWIGTLNEHDTGEGLPLSDWFQWSGTFIENIELDIPKYWEGKTKYLWVETWDGYRSDAFEIDILPDPDEPYIESLNKRQCRRGKWFKIYGVNFGDTQGDGEVRIGKGKQAKDSALGLGKKLPRIGYWTDGEIRVKLKNSLPNKTNPTGWDFTTKYVWVEQDGIKSNFKPLKILPPLE